MTESACVVSRLSGLDRVRGLAVLLMLLDHVLAATGEGVVVRLSVTRLALPIFCLVAGSLIAAKHVRSGDPWAAPSSRRLWQLVAAALASSVLVQFLPFMAPVDVLVPLLLAFIVAPALYTVGRLGRALLVASCMAGVATFPQVWAGYHPLHVLGLVVVGYDVDAWRLDRLGAWLPASFEPMGRYALSVYVGHLCLLLALWVL